MRECVFVLSLDSQAQGEPACGLHAQGPHSWPPHRPRGWGPGITQGLEEVRDPRWQSRDLNQPFGTVCAQGITWRPGKRGWPGPPGG